MQKEPTTVEKLRGLRWSIALNSANTVFVQFTYFGSAFVLFLDRLGLSKADIGVILALVPFSNLVAIWIAPIAARYGYKRTFVTFFGLRKLVTFFLLLTPWVVAQFGAGAAFAFVAGVVGLFAAFRTVEETAYYPWYQEFVPNAVRGKYTANSTIATALVGVVSVAVAGWVIEVYSGLFGFMALITVGVIFGLVSTWCGLFIPGGAPIEHDETQPKPQRDLRGALRDPDFMRYLIGLALITLGTVPVASFLPLFLEEQVGLSSGGAVFVQMGGLLGTITSSFLWGWAADRYGGRPVTLTGIVSFVIMPFFWWFMPRGTELGLYFALGIAFLQGLANLAWGIGATRLFFGSVVPKEKNMDYLAIWFAWAGITAGLSQLAGGWILEAGRDLSGDWFFFTLDPYAPLFILAIIAPFLSIFLMAAIRGDGAVSMGQFAGLFLRGNPFMAMTSLVKFYSARDEYSTVRTTERLGQARSTLAVHELLEALSDPRFNVRFEAIQAAARMKPDVQLTAALVKILMGKNPALSVMAAWAIGRIGDRHAADALWQGMNSPYKSVRMHCVRSLGTLGDRRSGRLLLQRLETETDEGLQLAYASALGGLRVSKAAFKLLNLLYVTKDEEARLELALALARIVGDERFFIQLWRSTRSESGTALAQTVEMLKKKWTRWNKPGTDEQETTALLTAAATAFAGNDLAEGAEQLRAFLESAPLDACEYINTLVCQDCAAHLAEFGDTRQEYLILALHALHECLGRA
ncbi:MAG: HEAT repeat domain-containing protein [Caldilineaceae bacterium]|nr:HEAT repeat domain-containing protein [Caldilineaceae bacterium]